MTTEKNTIKRMKSNLDFVLKRSGLLDYITNEKRAILDEYRYAFREKANIYEKDDVDFFAKLKLSREIVLRDFIWFMKVVSNPKKVLPLHEVCQRFIEEGPPALPASYLRSEAYGGFFKWVEKPTVILVMYPRGFGKSTNLTGKALWRFLNRPKDRFLILHGDKDKVKLLIRGIANMMMTRGAEALFFEFFSSEKDFYKETGTKILSEYIRIEMDTRYAKMFNDEEEIRREATFTTGSPQIDRTGLHFDGGFFDDLVGDKNSNKRELQEKLCEYFDSLFGMEEYRDEGHMCLEGVGTRWRGPGLYQHIIDKHRSTVFQLPLTWDDTPGISYHYHKYRVAPFVTNEFVERKKAELHEWFDSQMYMKERPYDDDVSFQMQFTNIFAFNDDDAQDNMRITETRKDFINKYCVIVSKDPSYSIINKENDPRASKDVTITVGVKDDVFYLFDEFVQLGSDLNSQDAPNTLLTPVLDQIKRNNADVYMQDTFAQQGVLFQYFISRIAKEVPWTVVPMKYDKSSRGGTLSKAQRAQMVLGELIKMGKIRVHYSCTKAIAQLSRSDVGFDIIDALVQVCSRMPEIYNMIPVRKMMRSTTTKVIRRQVRRPLFETTGY